MSTGSAVVPAAPEHTAAMPDDTAPSLEAVAPLCVGSLHAAGHTLSVAESCTGGMLGETITAVPGASKVFWGGVIGYDDAAKRRLLGVSSGTLEAHGAASAETALEMAGGMRARAGTTWALAITGIAGPDGGSAEKPVGTVWIALDGPRGGGSRRFAFEGDRDAVRRASVRAALVWLERAIAESGPAGTPGIGPSGGDDG
ncbi:MAG: CinA family protein [Gemmatimonadota bacterium]